MNDTIKRDSEATAGMPADGKDTWNFRCGSASDAVPWHAVGEPVCARDIVRIIEFLLCPCEDDHGPYQRQMNVVREEIAKLASVSRPAGKLSAGPRVAMVERACAEYLKCKHACFLSSGTAGIEIAYRFAGLKAGDEVIISPIAYFAAIAYPLAIGARIIFADVDPATLNISPADVKRKISDRTRVIVPVHIGGYPADMDEIMSLAADRGITVIEDAAHAFGARYKGRMAGTIGHFGVYSFHEAKPITSLGEGGLLVTNGTWGEKFQQARFLGMDFSPGRGSDWPYDVVALSARDGTPFVCPNYSPTEIQAVALHEQMSRIHEIIARRCAIHEKLNAAFSQVPGLIPAPPDTVDIQSSHNLYLLQVDPDVLKADIGALKKALAARGIAQMPHFRPLYDFAIMKTLGYDREAIAETCPAAEEAFRRRFTHLPLHGLSDRQVEALIAGVTASAAEVRGG